MLRKMKFKIEFGPERFAVIGDLDTRKLAAPFGARVTEAQIGLQLFPEFKPSGKVAFELAPGRRKVLDGLVTFGADADGLVAVGTVHGHLPGVDAAEGRVEYRAGAWTGRITVESSQIKIPALRSGSVVITFDAGGMNATGRVLLGLPGGNDVDLSVSRRDNGTFVYTGKGTFQVPGIDPVDLSVTYAGDSLTAHGRTGIKVQGFTGKLAIHYRDGVVSGEGTLSGKKGRATLEEATVKYNGRSGRISGSGRLSYQVSENLIATAGVDIPEKGPVKVNGALTFPKPIPLFKPFGNRVTLFRMPTVKIPIPGASIGPIGLIVTVDGGIDADYSVGPGELRDTRVSADFNPFEEDKDLKIDIQSRLAVPAHAGVAGHVRAALAIDAGIASVSGGITVIASVNLDGGAYIAFVAHYEKDRFTAQAVPEINAKLVLGLALDADIKAEAGIGPFTVETSKVWHLKNFRYDTGLTFGMKAPISYDSGASPAFTPPTLEAIQWVLPKIDPADMLDRLMSGSGTESRG